MTWGPERNDIQVRIEPIKVFEDQRTIQMKIVVRNRSSEPRKVPIPARGTVTWHFDGSWEENENTGARPGRSYSMITLGAGESVTEHITTKLPKKSGPWELSASIASYPDGKKFQSLRSNIVTVEAIDD